MIRHIDYIDKKIAEYEKELDKEFDQDINTKLKHNKIKKANYRIIEKQLKDSGDAQISTTDPDAKAVVFQRNSVKVGYNIQAASDSKYKLLIAADTGDVNDTKALAIMVNKVQVNIDLVNQPIDVLADKGYHSGREIKACEKLNVNTFISPKESSSSKVNPDFTMDAFQYDEHNDTYTCPAKVVMKTNGRWYNKILKNGRKPYLVKHYKTKACKDCKLRTACISNKLGRIIERTEYAEYIKRNNDRVNTNPDYYRQRQQIIEHQFGTLKRHRHFDYTLMKGKENVLSEIYIAFSIYNLKRSMSIPGFSEIIRCLKDAFLKFLSHFRFTGYMECLTIIRMSINTRTHSLLC